jgi:hypothetical protein
VTNEETVKVLLKATELHDPDAETWLAGVVERLHSSGFMVAPSLCSECDRWLSLWCAVHGGMPDDG